MRLLPARTEEDPFFSQIQCDCGAIEDGRTASTEMRIRFFKSPAEFRKWLEKHSDISHELWVGFHKKASGKPSMTWPESVGEALCFGWIDGIRKSIDDASYTIRFSPRKRSSVWSAINIKRAQGLIEQGLMQPAGLSAFEVRQENRSGIYSYEQRRDQLAEPYASHLKANRTAWTFFQRQPPSYRKAVGWWVVSAKKEETRLRRLQQLMDHLARGQTLAQFKGRKASE